MLYMNKEWNCPVSTDCALFRRMYAGGVNEWNVLLVVKSRLCLGGLTEHLAFCMVFIPYSRQLRFGRVKFTMSQKRKILNLAAKGDIIKKCDGSQKKSYVAKEYEIAPISLSTILKNREQTLAELPKSEGAAKRKKIRSALYPEIEESLFHWFTAARAQNLPVSGPILQSKAKDLGLALGYENFDPGTGWLQRFKDRHNISRKAVIGESGGADVAAINHWIAYLQTTPSQTSTMLTKLDCFTRCCHPKQ